jgi:hypothetical protein
MDRVGWYNALSRVLVVHRLDKYSFILTVYRADARRWSVVRYRCNIPEQMVLATCRLCHLSSRAGFCRRRHRVGF